MRNRLRPVALIAVSLLCLVPAARGAEPAGKVELIDVRKIWDQAPHNAFTGLVRFNNRWFCTFREGATHVAPDGAARVLESTDGNQWTSAARVAIGGADVRDPKLCVTPDGRLMLSAGAVRAAPVGGKAYRTVAWFSRDGKAWGEPAEVGEAGVWMWRVVWHGDTAYGVGYSTRGDDRFDRLYASKDGVHFDVRVARLFDQGMPNEAGLAFADDGTAYCLLRRDGDGANATAHFGTAKPPYTLWSWKDTGTKVGGPDLIRLSDGRLLAGVRLYQPKPRTALAWVDPTTGKLTECLALPSGGDTSYPGLVWHDGTLWVSYYSSHEGKAAIYLARVKVPAADSSEK